MADWLPRLLVAAGLAVDAVVHYRLAGAMGLAAPGGVGADTLFRVQATAAVLAALYVLIRGSRPAYVVAGVVALAALGAVLVSTAVMLPAIGPIPSMYDPFWYPEKTASAIAEAVALTAAAAGWRLASRRDR